MPLATPMVTPQEGWRFADIQMDHTEHSSDRKPLLTKAALYNPISKSEDKRDGPNTLCQEDSIKPAEKWCSIYKNIQIFMYTKFYIFFFNVPSQMRAFSFYLFHLPSLFIFPSIFPVILVFVIWQLLPFNTTSFQIFGFGDEKKCRRVLGMPVSEFCAQLPYFKKKEKCWLF